MKHMKRMICLVLVVVMLSVILTGCVDKEKVKEQLCGSWGYTVQSIDGPCYMFYIFSNDGTYVSIWDNENAPSKNSEHEGTYEIKSSKIVLSEQDSVINFTFENDTLAMTEGDHELTRVG